MRVSVQTLGILMMSASGLIACSGDDSEGDLTGPQATLKAQLEVAQKKAPVFIDAYDRLVRAVEDGEAEDVTLMNSGASMRAVVNVDMDGDGSRETALSVGVNLNDGETFREGASLTVGGPAGTFESASGSATQLADGRTSVAQIGGGFFDPSSRNELILFPSEEGGLVVSEDRRVVQGDTGFEILTGEELPIFGRLFFEPDGDGFLIRAVADDESFVVVVRR